MFNGIDLSTATDIKLGSQQVSSVYYGSQLIWPTTPPPVPTEYFYIETYYPDTDIYLGNKFTGGMDAHNDLEYSLDKTTWNTLYYGSTNKYRKATTGKIYFRCTNPQISSYNNGMGMFCVNKDYAIGGNIMSLIFGANYENQTSLTGYNYVFGWLFYDETHLLDASNLILPATTLTIQCYVCMFDGCTSLTTAPNILPATTLTAECYDEMFHDCTSLTTPPTLPATTLNVRCYNMMFYNCTSLTTAPTLPATTLDVRCYRSMFGNCTSLTTAPTLPATILAEGCYEAMFNGCTVLTTVPALPATTLADNCYDSMFSRCRLLTTSPALPATILASNCYYSMFNGCDSLTSAPELLATTLTDGCYHNMFNGCTNLNYIKCLATDISATDCILGWLRDVSSTGTFYKDANTTWPSGASGIPFYWTTINI